MVCDDAQIINELLENARLEKVRLTKFTSTGFSFECFCSFVTEEDKDGADG